MWRATTPTHIFRFRDIKNFDKVLITYMQDGEIKLEKKIEDIQWDGNNGKVTLTQQETRLFEPSQVDIQVKVKFKNEAVACSKIFTESIHNVLNDQEM